MRQIVEIDVSYLNEYLEKTSHLKRLTGDMADKVLGEAGAEGRRSIGESHEEKLHFGNPIRKPVKSGGSWQSRGSTVYSVMDPKHGWYRSRNRSKNSGRLIGFSYDVSGRRSLMPISRGHVYSLMANLWGRSTRPYRKASPYFASGGSATYATRWRQGTVRKARIRFDAGLVTSRMPEIRVRAARRITPMVKEALEG